MNNSYKYYIHDRKSTARIRLSTSLMWLAGIAYMTAIITFLCETAGALTQIFVFASFVSAAIAFACIYSLQNVRNSRFAIISSIIAFTLLTMFFIAIAKNNAGRTMNVNDSTTMMTIIANM